MLDILTARVVMKLFFLMLTEHFVDVPEVVRLVPQERDEQFVGEILPQIMEDIAEDFKIVPQEQHSERICELVVDVRDPQVDVLEALQFQVRAASNERQRCALTWTLATKSFGLRHMSCKCRPVNVSRN